MRDTHIPVLPKYYQAKSCVDGFLVRSSRKLGMLLVGRMEDVVQWPFFKNGKFVNFNTLPIFANIIFFSVLFNPSKRPCTKTPPFII